MAEPGAFGAALRQARRAAGLSQEALAERAGLSADAVAALERGRRAAPRPDTLARLAAALGLAAPARAAFFAAAEGHPSPPALAPPTPPALPALPSPLFGREAETIALVRLVRDEGMRLVTLTGPGGVGKTRLALAVAATLAADFPAGLALVDLAPLRDPALVASVAARALGRREEDGREAREWLLAYLRERRTLLVLDNFEQVAEAAPLLADLLATCPSLALLVTSRTALLLRAEHRFDVTPLAVPELEHCSPDTIASFPSVRLFVARACAVRPDFRLDTANALAVAAICRRVDGIPLALELAAARVAVLSPAALLARLERRLPVLIGGARNAPDRQQTLRATLEWSYHLLDARQQRLFRHLAPFAGGATLEAITAVAVAGDGRLDLFDSVRSLVDSSLLRRMDDENAPRFAMLETIREYAGEQLAARGEAPRLLRAHASYFLSLAEEAEPHFQAAEEVAWFARLDVEQANLRAALAWSLEHDPEAGLRMAAALWPHWLARGQAGEGRGWLDRFLARVTAAVPARARGLLGAGALALQQSDWGAARGHLEAGLALSRALGEPRLVAWTLRELGTLHAYLSEYEAGRSLLEEALAIGRALADPSDLEATLLDLARLVRNRGEYAYAKALLREALASALARRATRAIAAIRVVLGDIARYEGNLAGAAAEYAGGLETARAVGHASYTVWALAGLGQVALWQGEFGRADELFREALGRYQELGNVRSVGFVLYMLGLTALKSGEIDRADALLREALVLRWQLGGRISTADTLDWLAVVACGRGQFDRAVRLHAAADGARAAVGATSPPIERETVDAAMRTARDALGDDLFFAVWESGTALPLDRAVAEALEDERSASPPTAIAEGGEQQMSAASGQQGSGARPRVPGAEMGPEFSGV